MKTKIQKLLIFSVVFTVLSVILWILTANVFLADFMIPTAIIAITLSALAVCFWVTTIICTKIKGSSPSPFLIIGITNLILLIISLTYGIYDINTGTGWFAGLAGTLILVFVVPTLIVILLANAIVGIIVSKKRKKDLSKDKN